MSKEGEDRRTVNAPHDLDDLPHLVSLERYPTLFSSSANLDLGFLALEHGSQREQLAVDAAH